MLDKHSAALHQAQELPSDRGWEIVQGDGPVVAAAIHNGHFMRADFAAKHQLSAAERLREEDPFTGDWTCIADTRIVGNLSRFQVDLNRPRDKCVYQAPADCWGLSCWSSPPAEQLVAASLALHDAFYAEVQVLLTGLVQRHGHVFVFDLHSYNHRRNGPKGPPADAHENPDVNLGTGTMDRSYWSPVVDAVSQALSRFDYGGQSLDVRENVKFQGGYFSRWIHQTFPRQVCSVAVEFKKIFMDEWTGQADPRQLKLIQEALASSLPSVRLALETYR